METDGYRWKQLLRIEAPDLFQAFLAKKWTLAARFATKDSKGSRDIAWIHGSIPVLLDGIHQGNTSAWPATHPQVMTW